MPALEDCVYGRGKEMLGFGPADIARVIELATLARRRSVHANGQVIEVKVIVARVRGSEPRPYQQMIARPALCRFEQLLDFGLVEKILAALMCVGGLPQPQFRATLNIKPFGRPLAMLRKPAPHIEFSVPHSLQKASFVQSENRPAGVGFSLLMDMARLARLTPSGCCARSQHCASMRAHSAQRYGWRYVVRGATFVETFRWGRGQAATHLNATAIPMCIGPQYEWR